MCFTHHKCATQWIRAILRDVCDYTGMSFLYEDKWGEMPDGYRDVHFFDDIDFFMHANASQAIVNELKHEGIDYRGFHIVRDPRDILVSGYFSHRYSHARSAWLKEHAEALEQVGVKEGLWLELEHCKINLDLMRQWDYTDSNIYETRFEILTMNPLPELLSIFDFMELLVRQEHDSVHRVKFVSAKALKRLGLRSSFVLTVDVLRYIVERHSFRRKSGGRKKGEENRSHHYRKGVPGDWVNYFDDKLKQSFKDRYGDLVVQLGYENDYDW